MGAILEICLKSSRRKWYSWLYLQGPNATDRDKMEISFFNSGIICQNILKTNPVICVLAYKI